MINKEFRYRDHYGSRHVADVRTYFDGLASDWGKHYAEDGLMLGRISQFISACEKYAPLESRILDLGCGTGEIALALSEKGWNVVGCDISKNMLAQAQLRDGADKVEWCCIDIDDKGIYPFQDQSFDIITASSVLEYIDNPRDCLSECYRMLKPKGYILLTIPDERHPVRIKESHLSNKLFSQIKHLVRFLMHHSLRTDYYRYSISRHTPNAWCNLIADCKFSNEPIEPCKEPLLMLVAQKL